MPSRRRCARRKRKQAGRADRAPERGSPAAKQARTEAQESGSRRGSRRRDASVPKRSRSRSAEAPRLAGAAAAAAWPKARCTSRTPKPGESQGREESQEAGQAGRLARRKRQAPHDQDARRHVRRRWAGARARTGTPARKATKATGGSTRLRRRPSRSCARSACPRPSRSPPSRRRCRSRPPKSSRR